MPPLTPPDKPLSPACWRLLLVVACVLVFAFAMNAKVAVYYQSTQPQTSTSDKLWLDGQKMIEPPIVPAASVLWLATLVMLLYAPQSEMRFAVVDRTPRIFRASQLSWHRFLRPPPVR